MKRNREIKGDRMKGLKLRQAAAPQWLVYCGDIGCSRRGRKRVSHLLWLVYCGSYINEGSVAAVDEPQWTRDSFSLLSTAAPCLLQHPPPSSTLAPLSYSYLSLSPFSHILRVNYLKYQEQTHEQIIWYIKLPN